KLKTNNPLPNGRSVQCPKCKESFPVSPDNMVEVSDSKFGEGGGKPAPAAAKAPPARKPAAEDANPFGGFDAEAPKKGRRRDEDDEEEDRPRSKSRARDEDEDERPKGRQSLAFNDDDEEEEKPRKGRRRQDDDDDEDDRPRSRRRDDDDDDDDDD